MSGPGMALKYGVTGRGRVLCVSVTVVNLLVINDVLQMVGLRGEIIIEKLKRLRLRRSDDFLGSKELINRLSNSLLPRISHISRMSING